MYPVILYCYDASPFSVKVDNILLLKNIPFQKVHVSSVLPRPEITELLGIAYRRIPILAVGNDVYCDTSLIASVLERRFPTPHGYGTIFPAGKHGRGADTGLIKAFAKYYADNTLFPVAPSLLPWERFPPSFVQDRSLLSGGSIDVQKMVASRNPAIAVLSSHLSLLEEQLSDDREWLFDTELPGLADISVHFVFDWLKGFSAAKPLFDLHAFPNTLKESMSSSLPLPGPDIHVQQWLNNMSNFIGKKRRDQSVPQKITGDEAAALIMTGTFEPYNVVGFNATEAKRLGFEFGDTVYIAPEDTGRTYPTTGRLICFNREEMVVEVQGSKGMLRCHFPRLGFVIKRKATSKL